MKTKIILYYYKIIKQLWFKPLLFCFISVIGALLAHEVDRFGLSELVPSIKTESIADLLDTISSSMLVISIFAVASMVSAFSAAGRTATPRSFKIVVTDDVSQYALSIFIGAFIFSIVATVALDNGYYGKAGRFTLFLFTLILFAVVILTFLRWVERISKLGRLEHTIQQVEKVATKSLKSYLKHPNLKAMPLVKLSSDGIPVFTDTIGYVQNFDMQALQKMAVEKDITIQLNCIPGKFLHKNLPIAYIKTNGDIAMEEVSKWINKSIFISQTRIYESDPRFGFIALSEIASRALSPGINDPGTAIQIISSHERLLFLWDEKAVNDEQSEVVYDRIEVSNISLSDFFDDAFRPIARDGAGNIEVMLRLQKAVSALETIQLDEFKKLANQYSKEIYKRAKVGMDSKDDLKILKKRSLDNAKKIK